MIKPIQIDKNWDCYDLTVNKKGEIRTENRISSFFRNLLSLNSYRDAKVLSAAVRQLDLAEQEPFIIGPDVDHSILEKNLKATKDLLKRYRYLNQPPPKLPIVIRQVHSIARTIFTKVDSLFGGAKKDVRKNYTALARHAVALEGRLGDAGIGSQRLETADPRLLDSLTTAAQEWKERLHTMPEKELLPRDHELLAEAARHPHFCEFLLGNRQHMIRFFKWSIRSHLSTKVFINYPALQMRINRTMLEPRIGSTIPESLKIEERPVSAGSPLREQMVTLPVNGIQTNITGVTKGFFRCFANKNNEEGNIEFTADKGVVHWNPQTLAYFNPLTEREEPIDLDHPELFSQLPTMKVVGPDYFEKCYGKALAPDKGGYAAISTRSSQDLDPLNSHARIEVYVPNGEGGHLVYPVGKYTFTYPQKISEYLEVVGGTFPGVLLYPDGNLFRLDREQKGQLWECDQEKFSKVREQMRKELKKSRDNKQIFQFLGENCASWTQSFVDAVEGPGTRRLFKINMWDHHINGKLKYIYKPIANLPLPSRVRKFVLGTILIFLGGNKYVIRRQNGKTSIKTLFQSRHWNEEYSDLASKLVHDASIRIAAQRRREAEAQAAA